MSIVDQTTDSLEPICTVNPFDYLKISRHPDGTITRHVDVHESPATPDPAATSSRTISKDIHVNPARKTWIRIFLPTRPAARIPRQRRPLVVYFHGGGFVFLSAASTPNHEFCSDMAADLDAVVVSVEYRLAPEHRLPAAYDDALEALHFIKSSDEPWLSENADLSQCFLMGTSSGGNIAYHAFLRAAAEVDSDIIALSPMNIQGLILHHAYFTGVRRTSSEVRLVDNPILPLSWNDVLWELALPTGADRDHEYANPTVGIGGWDVIGRLGWRVLVMGWGGDPLIDRLVELAEMMKEKGVDVVGEFKEGLYHGFEILELGKAKPTFDSIRSFIKCKSQNN